MSSDIQQPNEFISSREACDRTGYSRPDTFLNAWKRAGLPVYKAPSGRNRVSEADLERFSQPAD